MVLTGCNSAKKTVTNKKATAKTVETKYNTATVKKDTINKTITVTANFAPSSYAAISAGDRGGLIKKIDVKKGDTVKKGQVLCELDSEPIQYDLKSAKIALEITKLDYDKAVADNAPQGLLYQLEAKLKKAQDTVKMVEDQLKNANVTASCDGEIVNIKNMSPGQEVNPNEFLFYISNKSSSIIQFDSKTSQGANKDFKIGQNVIFNYATKNYEGKVVSVPDPLSSTAGDSRIVVKPTSLPPTFKNGDSVVVELCLYNKKNVLCIPKEALKDIRNHAYVQVLKDGIITERFITAGLQGSDSIEIISGLDEGEQVILN